MFKTCLVNKDKSKIATANVILVANAFIWYLLAFNSLKGLTSQTRHAHLIDTFIIIGINTGAIVISGIMGHFLLTNSRT